MKLGITLNEVIRDFIGQFQYTYNKYIAESDKEEIDTDYSRFNLLDIDNIKFKKKEDLNNFLYREAPLEIFGHADQLHENINASLNEFIMDIEDEEEHEVILLSVEHNKSIPATNFFLSKTGIRFRNIKFTQTKEEIWNEIDVLITANPDLLEMKPENKKSIKIDFKYNEESPCDFQYKSLFDFINNREILDNLDYGKR